MFSSPHLCLLALELGAVGVNQPRSVQHGGRSGTCTIGSIAHTAIPEAKITDVIVNNLSGISADQPQSISCS